MNKNFNLGRRMLAVAAVVTVAGMFGLVHATLGLYQTPGAQYVGHWVWNDADTNTASVDVRVKAGKEKQHEQKAPAKTCIQNFKVEVTGVAQDGSAQTRSALVQIPLGFTRQVTVQFDNQLTSLTFIKILKIGGGSSACGLT